MTAKLLAQTFAALSANQQARQLARVAHVLTIDARDTYIAGTEAIADPVRLRGFNEIQHRVTEQIGHILSGDEGYPGEVFFAVLLEAVDSLRANLLRKELGNLAAQAGRSSRANRKAG